MNRTADASQANLPDEFWTLLDAACEGDLSNADRAKLELQFEANPDARRIFVDHIQICTRIRLWRKGERSRQAGLARVESGEWRAASGRGSGDRVQDEVASGEGLENRSSPSLATDHWPPTTLASNPQSPIPNPSFIPPIIVAPAPPHTSPFSINSPIGNFLFAYSASAVVLAVAVFLGWAIKMSNEAGALRVPSHGALDIVALPASGDGTWSVPGTSVGCITGLADCKWSGPATQARHGSVVRVGRRYALASGFLEISYTSGAKVILQGPCVYRVDSPRSGFLEIGKLTANVGARGEGRGTGGVASGQWSVASESRVSNPQSLIPNPLFAVRTPTAVVIDLGTEFGVEVEKSGTTRSHVFKGRVELRSNNSRGATARGQTALRSGDADTHQVIELVANQSASVKAGSDGAVKMTRNTTDQSGKFVRTMPRAFAVGIPPTANVGDRPGELAGVGENVIYAYAIDAAGQVLEHSVTAVGTVHLFVCGNRGITDIGSFCHGGRVFRGDELTRRITAAGAPNASARVFLHIPGEGAKHLGTLGGPTSRATRVNAAGQVVGASPTAAGAVHAFLYGGGKMHDLGTLGGDNSFAHDINATGQVVGASNTANGAIHAFLYTPGGGMKDLGALVSPKANSWALGIADDGRVSGCLQIEGGRIHVFEWSDGDGMRDLGDVGGDNRLLLCLNGRIHLARPKKGPFTIPGGGVQDAEFNIHPSPEDAKGDRPKPSAAMPRGEETPNSPLPHAREKRRTSP